MQWDIIIDDGKDAPVLAIEAKNRRGLDSEWASKWRRNILAHGADEVPPYLLMVFPDKFFLWKKLEKFQPDYEVDAEAALRPYFERIHSKTSGEVGHAAFETLVGRWLTDILMGLNNPDKDDASYKWLFESGLAEAIEGGRMRFGVDA